MNITLPPFLRKIQQSWWFQFLIVPALIAAAPGFARCAGENFATFTISCLFESGRSMLWTIAIYLFAILQQPINSPAVNPDGTPNKQVQEIVEADKAGQPVAVLPVPSPGAREVLRNAVESGATLKIAAGGVHIESQKTV